MNFFESHFWYNKRQRNGILLLLILIIVLQIIYLFADFTPENQDVPDAQVLDNFQIKIDSVKKIQKAKSKPKIYQFNPNFIDDYKGYTLGMSVKEIDKLLDYRSKNKYVNSAKEFQLITGISDSLLEAISKYFKFPEFTQKAKYKKPPETHKTIVIKDLNTVTEEQLVKINEIGKTLAKRIIAYRKLLNGFTWNDQLYEVYYLDKAVADQVLKKYQVQEKPKINRLDLNNATFKEILKLPYIDYNLTKKILNFRDANGTYNSLKDLKKIDSFPLEKYDRITLYLSVN